MLSNGAFCTQLRRTTTPEALAALFAMAGGMNAKTAWLALHHAAPSALTPEGADIGMKSAGPSVVIPGKRVGLSAAVRERIAVGLLRMLLEPRKKHRTAGAEGLRDLHYADCLVGGRPLLEETLETMRRVRARAGIPEPDKKDLLSDATWAVLDNRDTTEADLVSVAELGDRGSTSWHQIAEHPSAGPVVWRLMLAQHCSSALVSVLRRTPGAWADPTCMAAIAQATRGGTVAGARDVMILDPSFSPERVIRHLGQHSPDAAAAFYRGLRFSERAALSSEDLTFVLESSDGAAKELVLDTMGSCEVAHRPLI